jgi:hypothetical protein
MASLMSRIDNLIIRIFEFDDPILTFNSRDGELTGRHEVKLDCALNLCYSGDSKFRSGY